MNRRVAIAAVAGLALVPACSGTSQTTTAGPRPEAARATCEVPSYGGGTTVEVRSNGEIHFRRFGPDSAPIDSLIRRDSVDVAELLVRLGQVMWDELPDSSQSYRYQCSLQVRWPDRTRMVTWDVSSDPPRLAELIRIHGEIRSLAGLRGAALNGTSIEMSADTLGHRLETGCTGGITGGGRGVAVTRDGRFLTWEQPGPSSSQREVSLVRTDSVEASRLFKRAEDAGLARANYSNPSNMTCFLQLGSDYRSHEVSWGAGTRPREIRSLIDLADAITRAVGSR